MPTENALPFETITMDFITKLPPSGGFDTILTITDTDCTKASIFIPCVEAIDIEGVAQLYLHHIFPSYGIPKKIISDQDPRFISKFRNGTLLSTGHQAEYQLSISPINRQC